MKDFFVTREVTSLQREEDTFLIFDRTKHDFNYPLHYHPEYELNLILGAKGAIRKMGDSVEPISDVEMCLVGPNLYHVWENGSSPVADVKREITIQFTDELFPRKLLNKEFLQPVAKMLKMSELGLAFSEDVVKEVIPQMSKLSQLGGFEAYMLLQRLLYNLSLSQGTRTLAHASFTLEKPSILDDRVQKLNNFLLHNYNRRIRLDDVAKEANLSPVSCTRLLKSMTGMSFIDYLNDIRIGVAARLMIDTDKTVSEICFNCGFNNISNFNRLFKKRQGVTPTEFRNSFKGVKNIY